MCSDEMNHISILNGWVHICVSLFFLPIMLNLQFDDNSNSTNDLKLRDAMNDKNYHFVLSVGIGACIPLAFDLIYESWNSNIKISSIFERWSFLIYIALPNILLYFYLCPSQQYRILPCLMNTRYIFLGLTFFSTMLKYGDDIVWTKTNIVSLALQGILQNFCGTLRAFILPRDLSNILMCIQLAAFSSFFLHFLTLVCMWYKNLLKKRRDQWTLNEYICHYQIFIAVCLSLALALHFVINTSTVKWCDRDIRYLIPSEIFNIIGILITVWTHNNISRYQQEIRRV